MLSKVENKIFILLWGKKTPPFHIYVHKTSYLAVTVVPWGWYIMAADASLCVYSEVHDAVDAVAEKCNKACRELATEQR